MSGGNPALFISADMIKNLYSKILPTQGVYCAASIAPSVGKERHIPTHYYAATVDELLTTIDNLKPQGHNLYITPATYTTARRLGANASHVRSFFLDLDVGPDPKKHHPSKDEALTALTKFVETVGLPDPVRVDSGGGIHAYWPLDVDVPAAEWVLYAEKFKALAMANLLVDPAVPADAARLLRAVGTVNVNKEPKLTARVLDDEIPIYSFDEFKTFLGVEVAPVDIFAGIKKGLDEDTKALMKLDNYETLFSNIAVISLEDQGCAQIKDILVNAKTIDYDSWTGGLSVAIKCDDGEEAVQSMSEDHPDYDKTKVLAKARTFDGPRTCAAFAESKPDLCKDCAYRGKIKSPIQLGRRLRLAPTATEADKVTEENAVRADANSTPNAIPEFPEFLYPYRRGVNGGIYYSPPPVKDKKGDTIYEPPMMICATDVFPVSRMMSVFDGECLKMRVIMPNDPIREFLLPMRDVYSVESFKKIMTYNGVLPTPQGVQHLMNYVVKWGQYLLNTVQAQQMRTQMGWTEDKQAFVIGATEIRRDGNEYPSPSSPYVRGVAKFLKTEGTYKGWRKAADLLNRPGFELHAVGLLVGFGSPLMRYTTTAGATVCFFGESGVAKSGAMYAGLSLFGAPKELSVTNATTNALLHRFLTLHSIMFGLDEITQSPPEQIASVVHAISNGKARIKMQGSVNAEREHEGSASMLGMMTSNASSYEKFSKLRAPTGEVARTIELTIKPMAILKNDSMLGREMFDAYNHHHGHAGPMFIKHLFKNETDDSINEAISRWHSRFLKDFGNYAEYRFYENTTSSIFAAGEMANKANIINLDLERIYKVFMMNLIGIRTGDNRVNGTDYAALIGEFFHANHAGMLILDGSKVVSEPRLALVARALVHENKCYVARYPFQKFLSERGVSTKLFEHAMEKTDLMEEVGKQRLTTGWKAGIISSPVSVYCFKQEIPKELFTDEPIGQAA